MHIRRISYLRAAILLNDNIHVKKYILSERSMRTVFCSNMSAILYIELQIITVLVKIFSYCSPILVMDTPTNESTVLYSPLELEKNEE